MVLLAHRKTSQMKPTKQRGGGGRGVTSPSDAFHGTGFRMCARWQYRTYLQTPGCPARILRAVVFHVKSLFCRETRSRCRACLASCCAGSLQQQHPSLCEWGHHRSHSPRSLLQVTDMLRPAHPLHPARKMRRQGAL